ncbi:MAG TPA: hypothetical protein VHN74_13635 [Candidatus Angelobacter sp.]|jgi:hypothetical protein|nr:hypothetical protein [Candidatus Angelobacter sp.]
MMTIRSRHVAGILALCLLSAGLSAADLKPKTSAAFDKYVAATEQRFAKELAPGGPFFYIDELSGEKKQDSYQRLKNGEILIDKREAKAEGVSSDVPDGLLHHWVALVFVPGVTLKQTIPLVQDYDHRAELYKPEVTSSKLISHQGDDFKIFLRLYQKKFTTVVFNTEYNVHWGRVSPTEVYSDSISTRIAEVKDAAHPDGEEYPPGHGSGYLWRLNTYWRFAEKDGGVYIQCEALSLTRDIPTGLGWLLKPLVTSIPRNSLNRALGRTREVVEQHAKSATGSSASPNTE